MSLNLFRVFVISLESAAKRRAHITRELRKAGLNFEIVPAIDGLQIDVDELSRRGIVALQAPDRPGGIHPNRVASIGCALSHLQLLRRLSRADGHLSLVLEDDVVLDCDFHTRMENTFAQLPKDWHILFAGIRFVDDSNSRCMTSNVRVLWPGNTAGTYAYFVTRAGALRMVSLLTPIDADIDVQLRRHFGNVLRAYSIAPNVVGHSDEFRAEPDSRMMVNFIHQAGPDPRTGRK